MNKNTSILSEEELVAGLLSSNREVFSRLYDQYANALFGVIQRVVNDSELAADVLQESFVKIWERRQSYDASKGRLFTWMLNVARNSAIDATRSKHVKLSTKIQNLDSNVGNVNRAYSVNTQTDTIDMWNMVGRLPEEQKLVIEMQYFQGFTQEETSQNLGVPLGTVKTRTRTGLRTLREIFNSTQP